MPLPTVAAIGAVCLTVGWLLASTLTPPVAQSQARTPRAARPPAFAPAMPTEFAAPVQVRLPLATLPQGPRRNPFTFGRPAQSAAAEDTAPASEFRPMALSVPAPPAIVGPVFELAGIGITAGDRTAVLAEGDAVHIVKAGDVIGGYTVVEITDRSVTLEGGSGERRMLYLR